MKRKGWYKEPPKDSIQLKKIKDSLKAIQDKKLKKDSSKVKPLKSKVK